MKRIAGRITAVMRSNTIIPIFLGVFLSASLFVGNFFSLENFINILGQNAAKGVMAVGMTFLILN